MKATLGLELFNDSRDQRLRATRYLMDALAPGLGRGAVGEVPASAWVAEIVGFDRRFGYQRRFVDGRRDYSRANSKGTRGVFAWYILEAGRTYEVKAQVSWSRFERYYCFVDVDGNVNKITKEEVDAWLNRPGNEDWA